jgi:enoyl-CoA hydratase
MSQDFVTECDGTFLRITINHPEEGNAFSDDMAAELSDLLDGAESRARGVVLRGAGNDFCVGRTARGRRKMNSNEALDMRRANTVIFDCYDAFRRTRLPVISVVTGKALGFGCALAALGDITIASEEAQFQLPEFAHNIMPTMAMSSLLGKVTGKSMMYIVYSTGMLDARRAREIGLVNEVVAKGALGKAVDDICARIAAAPLPAVLAVKEFATHGPAMGMAGAIEYARSLHATVNSSSEMKRAAK